MYFKPRMRNRLSIPEFPESCGASLFLQQRSRANAAWVCLVVAGHKQSIQGAELVTEIKILERRMLQPATGQSALEVVDEETDSSCVISANIPLVECRDRQCRLENVMSLAPCLQAKAGPFARLG